VRAAECPCCFLPTLAKLGVYDICPVCWWQDDGQDDSNADTVLGGPNGHYSLTKARQNAADHGDMYDLGAGIAVVEVPSAARQQLMAFALTLRAGSTTEDEATLHRLIAAQRKTLG
jgi:hypothetical protein